MPFTGATEESFLPEDGPSAAMSDAAVAAIVDIAPRAVTSFRAGIPDWVLIQNVKAVAAAIGADPQDLRAQISAAQRKIWGRGAAGSLAELPDLCSFRGLL